MHEDTIIKDDQLPEHRFSIIQKSQNPRFPKFYSQYIFRQMAIQAWFFIGINSLSDMSPTRRARGIPGQAGFS